MDSLEAFVSYEGIFLPSMKKVDNPMMFLIAKNELGGGTV